MQNKYKIEGLQFKTNQYGCGHETFYTIMEQLNQIELSMSEFYLAANPKSIEYLNGEVILGYNDLEKTIHFINENTTANIERVICTSKEQDLEDIVDLISKGNIITLYLFEKALIHHRYEEAKYPYHVVIADGYDLDNKQLHIVDLFTIDDFECDSQELYIDMELIMDNLYEYLIFRPDKSHVIKLKNGDEVKKIMEEFQEDNSIFNLIRDYFHKIENHDFSYRIRSVCCFKWLVSYPLFMNCSNYFKCMGDEKDANEMKSISDRWDLLQMKYVKNCCRKKEKDFYTELKIDELIEDTIRVLARAKGE